MTDKGGMTLAEGHWDKLYKVDAGLTFNSMKVNRKFVLRTTLERLEDWKRMVHESALREPKLPLSANFDIPNIAPLSRLTKDKSPLLKKCAIVNNELWIFEVNATIANDIFQSVKIGMSIFDVPASDIIGDIYVKNLNAEFENEMSANALVDANKALYRRTCEAIKSAANLLGISTGSINFWILSNIKNHKIPKEDLHDALRDGGANFVDVSKESFRMRSISNDWLQAKRLRNHLHLARFDLA